ncbi:MAG: YggS family pyridoxal phosphate-dependent enzyme [Planctomycetota bacterium]
MGAMATIAEKIGQVRDNIQAAAERSGRDISRIKLIIVTKSTDTDSIKEVIRLGFCDFGENRVGQLKKVSSEIAEFLTEFHGAPNIPQKVNWHMIGHLQRNKVRQVLPIACLIHSLDTLRLAEELNSVAGKLGVRADVLLQVNSSGEPQKYGVPVGAATHMAEQIQTLPKLSLRGLMTMAPLTHDKDTVRACFVRARELFEEIRGNKLVGKDFTELSMGMSQDYEIAVEEGATILRIGSAIFTR